MFAGLQAWFRGDPAGGDDVRRLLDGALTYALPLTRRFRGTEVREGMLLRGPSGWGEFAPFPEYDAPTSARWLAAAVEAAYGSWPDPVRTEVPVNAIVPAVGPEDAAALTRAAVERDGCGTVKVKVAEPGQSLAEDEARVAAVRAALDQALGTADGRIRLDANGAWPLDVAQSALRVLDRYGLEYVEQPCATLAEMAELRRRVPVPLAVDEGIRRAEDPYAVDLSEAADVAVVKVPPLGGVARALELASHLPVPVVVSGALDSSVGLSAGLALAGALPSLPFACGLGTGALLAADVVATPVRPVHGRLPVVRTDPDLEPLLAARGRLSDSRSRWWRRRLSDAWEAGGREAVGHLVRAAR
ncbi:MAG: o-succinylbenzoate synthase [Candidatus Nanopelagicales bacterium]